MSLELDSVPILSPTCSAAAFQAIYDKFQVVLLRDTTSTKSPLPSPTAAFGLTQLAELYKQHSASIQKTFGVENGPSDFTPQQMVESTMSVGAEPSKTGENGDVVASLRAVKKMSPQRWYASYLVQKDKAYEHLASMIPLKEPKVLLELKTHHTPCIWVFVCRNIAGTESGKVSPLRGRAEHIDAVQHSGTWHLQVSGTKTWRIRPNHTGSWTQARVGSTQEGNHMSPSLVASTNTTQNGGKPEPPMHLEVVVKAGDVFVINTRLWFHQTHINDTASARQQVSFSYARDFYFVSALHHSQTGPSGNLATTLEVGGGQSESDAAKTDDESQSHGSIETETAVDMHMQNVEGTYAVQDFDEGDVVLEEQPLCAVIHHGTCAKDNDYVACASCLRCFLRPSEQAALIGNRATASANRSDGADADISSLRGQILAREARFRQRRKSQSLQDPQKLPPWSSSHLSSNMLFCSSDCMSRYGLPG